MIFNLKKIDRNFLINADKKNNNLSNEEIKEIIHNSNTFQLNINNDTLDLYVGELFFPAKEELQQILIKIVLSTIYFHNGNASLKGQLFGLVKDLELDEIFPYLLTFKNDNIKRFNILLNQYNIKEKFLNLFLKKSLNDNDFINMLIEASLSPDEIEEFLIVFKEVSQNLISKSSNPIELKILNDSKSMKGNIFQLLASKMLFNKDDSIYYNKAGGGNSGSLYPDILFKNKSNLFICDTKCYQDDNEISPHKEFFYNILLSEVTKNVLGILFTYDKENINTYFKIKKCYKLEGHFFFLISLNILKCLSNLLNNNSDKISIASQIADEIENIHKDIKSAFSQNKTKFNDILLINYNINDEIIEFCSNN